MSFKKNSQLRQPIFNKYPYYLNKKNFIRTVFYLVVFFLIFWLITWFYYSFLTFKKEIAFSNNLTKAEEIYSAIPLWHKKIKNLGNLKIGIITDTHLNLLPQINSKNITTAQPGLIKFVKEMNVFQPDFIVHLGDIIEGTRCPAWFGEKQIKLLQGKLNLLSVPVYWVAGNHDLRSLTKEEFKKTLALNSLNYIIDKKGYRFIFLDANYNKENLPRQPHQNKYIPGHLPPSTLKWLEEQLKTNKRIFVFMHQGLFPGKTTPTSQKMVRPIDNAEKIKKLFEKYRVDGFFNGHMEVRAYHKEKYTNYYSLTGTVKNPYYTQSFYELNLEKGVPKLTMYYFSYPKNKEIVVDFEKEKNF